MDINDIIERETDEARAELTPEERAALATVVVQTDEDEPAPLPTLTEAERRALWNQHCYCGGRADQCSCIQRCLTCGHVRAEHDYSGDEIEASWGSCTHRNEQGVPDCTECHRFEGE